MSRQGEPLRLHVNDVIPACGDIDSCAHAPCQSKTPISHWTAGRFCDGCLGGGRGRHESGSPSFSNYRFGEPSEKKTRFKRILTVPPTRFKTGPESWRLKFP